MPPEEHRLPPLTPSEEATVRALAQVMMELPHLVDADMVRDAQIPLSEYTTLMHLSEAPERHMRMSELAAACSLSLSGMTRVVSRLEKQGLVQRAKCSNDGRGWNAVLTDSGLARLKAAWPTHLASVRRHIITPLAGHDLAQPTAALQAIATTPAPTTRAHT